MKNKFNLLTLSLICFGLISFLSCQKEDATSIENQFDFNAYYLELKDNPYYNDFIDANTAFFNPIKNKEVDLVALHHALNSPESPTLSSDNFEAFKNIHGIEKFWPAYFIMKEKRQAFKNNVELHEGLSEDELAMIYTSTYKENTGVISSRANCVYLFTVSYGNQISGCDDDDWECEDLAMSWALMHYNNCCSSGGNC